VVKTPDERRRFLEGPTASSRKFFQKKFRKTLDWETTGRLDGTLSLQTEGAL
jgi:hypothetical protein